jgi:hypothetical protein
MNLPLFSLARDYLHSLVQAVKRHLRQWTRPDNHDLVLNSALDLTRRKSELPLENLLLHQQLIVLKQQAKRPALTWDDSPRPGLPVCALFTHTLTCTAGMARIDSRNRQALRTSGFCTLCILLLVVVVEHFTRCMDSQA